MLNFSCCRSRRVTWIFSSVCISLSGLLLLIPKSQGQQDHPADQAVQQIKAFQPGESLSYDISWSNLLKAGTAVMKVQSERLPDGREVLRFSVISHTTGIVNKLYSLGDTVQSVFDPETMQTLSFSLREMHGKKTRRRDLLFDHEHDKVTIWLNNDPPETVDIPDPVQDSLTALYYLRTREDFSPERPISFGVFDSDKSWDIEVQTLGRERVKTPAGEFSTIKVRAYRGLFMSEGEIFIWLTDDVRKIPVIIKSKISIGSLVFTLTHMELGEKP